MLLLSCFINIWREIHPFYSVFLVISKISIFEVPITTFVHFFPKSVGDIIKSFWYDSRACLISNVNNQKQFFFHSFFVCFFLNCNFLWPRSYKCCKKWIFNLFFILIYQDETYQNLYIKVYGVNWLTPCYRPLKKGRFKKMVWIYFY